MKITQRMESLRALAIEEPSPEVWGQVVELFDTWEWSDDLAVGLDYANAFLSAWPDELRTTPERWSDILLGQPKSLIPRAWKRGERAHPAMRLVRVLTVRGKRGLSASELKALTRAGASVESIVHLSLASQLLGDEGALKLSACRDFVGLQRLDLSSNGLSPQGIWDLVRAGWFDGLQRLELTYNRFGYEGARGLAECAGLSSLSHLGIVSTDLDAYGAQALASSPHLGMLRSLSMGDFSWRSSVPAVIEAFGGAAFAGELRSLEVQSLRLDAEAAEAFARARLTRLEVLELPSLTILAEPLRLLLDRNAFPALRTIRVDYVDDATLKLLQDGYGPLGVTVRRDRRPWSPS